MTPKEGETGGYVSWIYDQIICAYPGAVLVSLLLAAGAVMLFIPDFDIEASGDALLMQQNQKLQYYRKINQRYDRRESVLITYQPETDLLSPATLDTLRSLTEDLRSIEGISSVVSILDVPLLKNPPGPLKTLNKRIKTLSSPDVNTKQARRELKNSPLYSSSLVSSDFTATAIKVNFSRNESYQELKARRLELRRMRRTDEAWNSKKDRELRRVTNRFEKQRKKLEKRRQQRMNRIRSVVQTHSSGGNMALGGIPVIVDHIISYIKHDLWMFGLGILTMVGLILALILRRARWIVCPLLTCLLSGLVMIGLLGLLGWNVTVVSSNFISLQLIFTMALVIHIVIRYCEQLERFPDAGNQILVRNASSAAFVPCFYAILTTSAGFSSLLISDLKPVVSFAWIMIAGVLVSFIVTFLFLPAVLSLLSRPSYEPDPYKAVHVTAFFGRITERFPKVLLFLGAGIFAVTLFGVSELSVESSFVNYFRSSTDVYRSLKFIDQKLGGTTPLQIIVDFKEAEQKQNETSGNPPDNSSFSEFENYTDKNTDTSENNTYWFTSSKLEKIERVHDELDRHPETGKVRSLAMLWKIGKELHGGPLDTLDLQLLMDEIPPDVQKQFLDRYVSVDHNQAQITTRIMDSSSSLNRDRFLNRVRTNLVEKNILDRDQFRMTGLFVLYNDMLQSLFRSQMETIGVTVLLICVVLYLLFRSFTVMTVAVIPNLIATTAILGFMGLVGISLDLMTITIVAISVGIALDDTIHYLHRFKSELEQTGSYPEAMHRCHGTIGNALAYTTMIIVMGFAVLVMSKFIPTVRFGLLTALAMIVALISALTLLPAVVLVARPFDVSAE